METSEKYTSMTASSLVNEANFTIGRPFTLYDKFLVTYISGIIFIHIHMHSL